MNNEHHALAKAYFDAVTAGELPDSLLTTDMQAWITTTGPVSKEKYQYLVRLLSAMCKSPLQFSIHSLTAEEDRVIAEAESVGTLINDEEYRNSYVFVFRIKDGKIASVAEHYNALIAQDKLVPLMEQAAALLAENH